MTAANAPMPIPDDVMRLKARVRFRVVVSAATEGARDTAQNDIKRRFRKPPASMPGFHTMRARTAVVAVDPATAINNDFLSPIRLMRAPAGITPRPDPAVANAVTWPINLSLRAEIQKIKVIEQEENEFAKVE